MLPWFLFVIPPVRSTRRFDAHSFCNSAVSQREMIEIKTLCLYIGWDLKESKLSRIEKFRLLMRKYHIRRKLKAFLSLLWTNMIGCCRCPVCLLFNITYEVCLRLSIWREVTSYLFSVKGPVIFTRLQIFKLSGLQVYRRWQQ